LPNKGKIFAFELAYTGKEAFVQGFNAFQNWFPTASRLWGFDEPRLAPITSLGEPPNPYFSVLCYYWGSELIADGLCHQGDTSQSDFIELRSHVFLFFWSQKETKSESYTGQNRSIFKSIASAPTAQICMFRVQ